MCRNYSPTLVASKSVASRGHHQVLWLLEDQVIEVGASNIFFVFKGKGGEVEIATPDLEDLILPGVTRDSILVPVCLRQALARDKKEYRVSERRILITEVVERQQKGELLEMFGAGTAVIINSVKNFEYQGKNYGVPMEGREIGPIAEKLRGELLGIQEGRVADKFGWVRRVV